MKFVALMWWLREHAGELLPETLSSSFTLWLPCDRILALENH